MRTLQGLILGLILIVAAACGSAEGDTAAEVAGETATTPAPTTTETAVESIEEPTTTTLAVETVETPETTVPDNPPRRQQQVMRDLLIPGNPEIENTLTTIEANDDELEVVVSTSGLIPGNPMTVWVIALEVDECREAFPAIQPCQPFVLTVADRTDLGNIHFLGGGIPDEDGAITVTGTLTKDGLPRETEPGEMGWWYDTEIGSFRDYLFHVIIHDHGPPIDGIVDEMWSTFRGGCTVESLGPGIPDNALNDGTGGPNTCLTSQGAPFEPEADAAESTPVDLRDLQLGTMSVEPAQVDTAGDYELTIFGSTFIPNSEILVGPCIAPGNALVLGKSTPGEVQGAQNRIDPLQHCRLGEIVNVTTDEKGTFTITTVMSVTGSPDPSLPDGTNFVLGAGTLDGAQSGGVWIPVINPG